VESSWAPIDLAAVADGSAAEEPPSILVRTDGQPLLYRRKRHLLAGEPESGKGWVAMAAAAPEVTARRRVLYLDFENTATTALERLDALGVQPADVLEHFIYIRPDSPPDVELGTLGAGAVLAIVDGVTEAMNLLGLNPYDNRDVAEFLSKIARPLADAGAAVLLVDHVVKDRDNRGRWAIGAQHKMAGVDVSLSLEVIRPFGRGLTGGLSRLTVTKDRPGFLRQYAAGRSRLGDVHMDSEGDSVSVRIEPAQDAAEGEFRYTAYMERVSRYLEVRGEQTKNAIESDVRGKRDHIRAALVTLEAEGYVTSRDGARGATLFVSAKAYREADE
jgi:AAA domain